jgi:hypothetical protein
VIVKNPIPLTIKRGLKLNLGLKLMLSLLFAKSVTVTASVLSIDLVLIDPQSVGKRTHDLMDTVNAKKRWKTICCRANKYLKYNHLLPRFGTEQASFCI